MSFLTLDLNLLRVFDAIMTEQNLTRAASRMAMTQPAVSNALKRLRDALDDDLVVRTAHGVRPTARAETLWPTVRRALIELEQAVSPSRFDIAKAKDRFRIATTDATAALWLPSLVHAIESEAPELSIRMAPLTTRDPRHLLLHGDVDVAVGSFPGVAAQLASGSDSPILHERLYTSNYVCVMRRDHPLARQELTLDGYCQANHLLVSVSGRPRGQADEALAQIDRERRILLTVNQFFTGGRVVANSDLLAVLPRHLVAATGMTEYLVIKELPFEMPPVHIDMLWHERDARNQAHQWLRRHLMGMAANIGLPVDQAPEQAVSSL